MKRFVDLDIIAGILIIRMMLGHFTYFSGLRNSMLYDTYNIFFFYMPWFFYKSGMFFKPAEGQYKVLFNKLFKSLLVPYILFTILGIACGCVYSFFVQDETILRVVLINFYGLFISGASSWCGHLWFLLSLFVVKYLYESCLYKAPLFLVVLGGGIFWVCSSILSCSFRCRLGR